MNETTEHNEPTAEAGRVDPVVITVGQFEEWMRYTKTTRAFIFAKYKGRWVEATAEDHGSFFLYLFFNSSTNALMSECITMINVPRKPCEL